MVISRGEWAFAESATLLVKQEGQYSYCTFLIFEKLPK